MIKIKIMIVKAIKIMMIMIRSMSTLRSGWSTGRCLGPSPTMNKASHSRCLLFRSTSSSSSSSSSSTSSSSWTVMTIHEIHFSDVCLKICGKHANAVYILNILMTTATALSIKLFTFLFQFINFYASLIYIAFFKVKNKHHTKEQNFRKYISFKIVKFYM